MYKVDQSDTQLVHRQKAVPLLVHGMNADCQAMKRYVEWFKESKYRVGNVTIKRNENIFEDAFNPNGQRLKDLSDTFYGYLQNKYDPEYWNNKIIAVAHSRGALDVENAILFHNADKIKGIIELGNPFWGSGIANLCLAGSLPPSFVCLICGWNTECWRICLSMGGVLPMLCVIIGDLNWTILNSTFLTLYRIFVVNDKLINTTYRYHLGIGYDTNDLCRNFTEDYDVGCFILRYIMGYYANDGIVEAASVYKMQDVYTSNRVEIISPICKRWVFPPVGECPSPDIWRKDHTQVKESEEIFYRVREVFEEHYNTFQTQSSPPGKGINPLALKEIEEQVKTVESYGYITALNPNDTLKLTLLGNVGEITSLMISQKRLTTNPEAQEQISQDTTFKFQYIYRNRKGKDTLKITTNEQSVLIVGFQTPIKTTLKRDKVVYNVGDTAYLELKMPPDEYNITAFYLRDDTTGDTITFIKKSQTIYNAKLPITKSGYYQVIAQVEGRIYKRTFIMLILALEQGLPVFGHSRGYYQVQSTREGAKSENIRVQNDIVFLPQKEVRYKVYDINGRLISEGYSEDGAIKILKSGIYIIKVKNKTYKVLIK